MKKFIGLVLKLALADFIAGWMLSLTKMVTKKTKLLLAEYETQLNREEDEDKGNDKAA